MTTTKLKTISEMLTDRRDEMEHSQSRAADMIGVSRQIYSQWESGHAIPGDQFIPPIAVYLGVNEDALALQRYHEKLGRARGVYVGSFEWDPVAFAEGYADTRDFFRKADEEAA